MKDLIDFKKSYSMNAKIILIPVIILFTLVGGMGCENNDELASYYKGKVIALDIPDINRQKAMGFIKIEKSIPNGLQMDRTIEFDPSALNRKVETGDVLTFKILDLEPSQPTFGLFPDNDVYFATIELNE
jgi:hypothetical protein